MLRVLLIPLLVLLLVPVVYKLFKRWFVRIDTEINNDGDICDDLAAWKDEQKRIRKLAAEMEENAKKDAVKFGKVKKDI